MSKELSQQAINQILTAIKTDVVKWIVAANVSNVSAPSGGGTGLTVHDLASGWHTGTLLESQAPWALSAADLAAHTAIADAHHNRAHVLATNAGLGPDHSMSGATAGHVLRASAANAAVFAQLQHGDLGGVTANQHHNQQHSITGTDHTITGADWDVVMNVGTATPGLRSPSYDVSAGETALLRSNAGALTVNVLTAAGTSAKLRTPLIDTASGDLTLSPATGITTGGALHASSRVRSPLLDTASGSMSISPAVDLNLTPVTDVVLNPGGWVELTDGKTIRTASFASGFVGNGLRIDQGVADAGHTTLEVDNVWVRGRMHVYELLIHQIRATNGSIFVSNTGKVTAVSGTGPYTLTTDPEHGFAVNDLIRAQRFTGTGVYQSNLQVTSVTNSKVFVATLSSGDAPVAGMDFVRLGNTTDASRRGGLYLTADDSGAPYMDIFDGVSSFATWGTAGVIKVRLGKLDGLALPGSYTSEYGIYAGNGTLDTSAYIRLSNKTNRLNNLPMEWWSGGAKVVSVDSTDGLVMQTSTAYADQRSVTWKSTTTKIADVAAFSNPGTGRQVGLSVYQSSATDLSILWLLATNTSSKWPYVIIQAMRNTASSAEDVTMYVGSVAALAFTGVYIDHNAKVSGTLEVSGAQTFTGAATFSSTLAVTSYISVRGGDTVLDQASGTYRGLSMKAQTASSWAYGLTYRTAANVMLGSFGAYGPANTIDFLYIGVNYTDYVIRVNQTLNQVGIGTNYTPAYTLDVGGTFRATGAAIIGGTLATGAVTSTGAVESSQIFQATANAIDIKHNNGAHVFASNNPAGNSYINLGYSRTVSNPSYVDFYTDSVTPGTLNMRIIRWGGVNGAADFLHYGTGLMRFGSVNAADVSIISSGSVRMTFDSAGEITNATQHNGPTFNATTGFERSGVAGGIFVPLPSGGYLVDTGGTTWNGGTSKAAGTYTFDMQAAGNGSIPSTAKALVLQMMGKWTSANDGYYTIIAPNGGTFSMVVRAQAGNITQDCMGIVLLGTNGDITATVAGAISNTYPLLRIHGYFI